MVKLRKFAYLGKNEFAELHKKAKREFDEVVNLLNFIKEYNSIFFVEEQYNIYGKKLRIMTNYEN